MSSNNLYYKGKLISGIAKIPRLTLNDYKYHMIILHLD